MSKELEGAVQDILDTALSLYGCLEETIYDLEDEWDREDDLFDELSEKGKEDEANKVRERMNSCEELQNILLNAKEEFAEMYAYIQEAVSKLKGIKEIKAEVDVETKVEVEKVIEVVKEAKKKKKK